MESVEKISYLFSKLAKMEGVSITMEELGKRMREVRLLLGMTQSVVGEKIGVKQIAVTRCENGDSIIAGVLLKFLSFYSKFVSIDVLLDTTAWKAASIDKDLLLRKPHINTVVSEKLFMQREKLQKRFAEVKSHICKDLNDMERYMSSGFESAIELVKED